MNSVLLLADGRGQTVVLNYVRRDRFLNMLAVKKAQALIQGMRKHLRVRQNP
jgi:hypothetical protein